MRYLPAFNWGSLRARLARQEQERIRRDIKRRLDNYARAGEAESRESADFC